MRDEHLSNSILRKTISEAQASAQVAHMLNLHLSLPSGTWQLNS